MGDYSHLQKLEVTQETEAEYKFTDIVVGYNPDGSGIHPSIWFRPMLESNALYLNERIKLSTERADRMAASNKDKGKDKVQQLVDRIEEDREQDRILIARACGIRWGTAPLDKDGKAHDFTPDECLSFLRAVPSYAFEPLRSWLSNPYNFIDQEAFRTGGGVVNAEALGNS